MFHQKKGQFFLVFALVAILLIFTIYAPYNTIKQSVVLEDFQDLNANYQQEVPKVINKATLDFSQTGNPNDLPSKKVQEFTNTYTTYAQGKEPTFGVFYVIKDPDGSVKLVNFLPGGKTLKLSGTDLSGKKVDLTLASGLDTADSKITLNIYGAQFSNTVHTSLQSFGDLNTQNLNNLQRLTLEIDLGDHKEYIDINPNVLSGSDPFSGTTTAADQTTGTVKVDITPTS